MYNANHKILMRKILKNRWRDIWCSWTGKFNMIKMSILSKLIYRLNPFFKKSKLQQNFLDIAKIVQSFYEKEKETTLKKIIK